MGFEELGLDPRLVRALAKRDFTKPTPVQQDAIPRTLEGKDIVARARTGSGKTLAYLLPALHRILLASASSGNSSAVGGNGLGGSFQALILVPTRELCEQVRQEAAETAALCGSEVSVTALVADAGPQLKRAIATAGHLVVSTPGRIAKALQDGVLPATALSSRLQMLVLDEADLLLSYGFEADLALLAPQIPRACQCMLMSATVSPEVERLTQMVLHNPITLNLINAGAAQPGGEAGSQEESSTSGLPPTIEHFFYECATSMDRLLVMMALLRLGLVRKKTLTFVNTVDQGYRVKLFLESFGVRAALLNAELPLNSRSHILQSFNRGLFDHLIATDDVHAPSHDAAANAGKSKQQRQNDKGKGRGAKGKGAQKDEEFGVTRGIDFKGVHTVINFDLPSSLEGYVHRVGRTGRAGHSGIAITLLTPTDASFKGELECLLSPAKAAAAAAAEGAAKGGEAVISDDEDKDGASSSSDSESDDENQHQKTGKALRPFSRLSKAQEYFEDHAAERQLLRHDKPLHKTPQAPHLRHMPAYLKDPNLIKAKSSTGNNSEGKPMLPHRKARKLPPPPEASIQGTTSASFASSKEDPLKSVKGFARAPKRRGHHDEEMTEMEKQVTEAGLKEAKKKAKMEGKLPQIAAAARSKNAARKFKRKR
ncbi:DEAD-domain-containing protein [Dunaliella salina]|uniref:RNA helicase n=1 Tax=Dunaliella salina TaxID=3046 RepID=A0ABQ7FW08_DUNSA|nr:DEAD-domain-containing protein [Dunaliella salina]|eukprot:KAF5826362.1 DEAD-domain-containing protein [Dunaliella salina]